MVETTFEHDDTVYLKVNPEVSGIITGILFTTPETYVYQVSWATMVVDYHREGELVTKEEADELKAIL